MGIIVNPRGTAGAGKTALARRVMARYGWPERGAPLFARRGVRPLGWRLEHPDGGRPLVVIGHYGGTVGGCDTIRRAEGGLAGALAAAGLFASAGHDVLVEGLSLSGEAVLSARLAAAHDLHVLRLATPPEACVRHLQRRGRCGAALRPRLAAKVLAEEAALAAACAHLSGRAAVAHLPFAAALDHAARLLALGGNRAAA